MISAVNFVHVEGIFLREEKSSDEELI